jgi:hypothetical protein
MLYCEREIITIRTYDSLLETCRRILHKTRSDLLLRSDYDKTLYKQSLFLSNVLMLK